ncbi:656_t:CDS:2 [Acaulospora colombiana]|uniref:656_t:CDS:1 n=1 Tax=Acaulospora colombiana TaxID=27376 RepID=A0ACA9M2P5_9GLOM|nr:656_t:CDS:2 [Acaulospora colombiana]
MIRWDAAGEHIIVERPEQLALHVLPSVYRQSRFASFSRQLNVRAFLLASIASHCVVPALLDARYQSPSVPNKFMVSCAKSTSAILIRQLTILMLAHGVPHPTLRRNSPADVIANFKRRVPPRLPKPRKRPEDSALTSGAPRTAVSLLPFPSYLDPKSDTLKGRARGFSAPGSYTQPQPTWQSATPFGQAHARQALPPLAPLSTQSNMPLYPSGPHSSTGYMGHQPPPGNGLHHRSSHGNLLHPLTPATPDDPHSPHHLTPGGYSTHPQGYGQSGRDPIFLSGGHGSSQGTGYGYNPDGGAPHSNWSFLPPLQTGNTTGPLSSLLNPSTTRKQHSYSSTSSSQLTAQGNNASVSPDSRPTTGYSVASSSMSIPYEDMSNDYRPRSSAGGRPMTPTAMNSGRPPSAHSRPSSAIAGTGPPPPSHLRIGRARRHSQAVSPYPAPFYDINDGRPVTAPDNTSVHRVRSFGNLPQVDSIGEETGPQGGSGVGQAPFMGFNGTHADFAYSAGGGGNPNLEPMDGGWLNGSGASHAPPSLNPPPSGTTSSMQGRPSTAASTMSAHSSASATQTPPVMDTSFTGHDTDINRCE